MKKITLTIFAVAAFFCCKAQQQLEFPFQGGSTVLHQFFKDSLIVTPDIIDKKATGLAIFKFTADSKGRVSKIIVYYADDAILIGPIIDALKKSDRKWIIPDKEKLHDFIIPFSISFTPTASGAIPEKNGLYNFYLQHKPMITQNQVPLDMATLLPTVQVSYELAP